MPLSQLRNALGQVKLAESNRQYARETLTQVNDRFDPGVTNTVEVVQAQQQELPPKTTTSPDYMH